MIKRGRELDERLSKQELGQVKGATVVRVTHSRGFGFLRGDDDDADTFFHVHVVRYTEAEMKKRRERKGGVHPPIQAAEAFLALSPGDRVLFLPSGVSKDGKGPRARWVGVGDPGGL